MSILSFLYIVKFKTSLVFELFRGVSLQLLTAALFFLLLLVGTQVGWLAILHSFASSTQEYAHLMN